MNSIQGSRKVSGYHQVEIANKTWIDFVAFFLFIAGLLVLVKLVATDVSELIFLSQMLATPVQFFFILN